MRLNNEKYLRSHPELKALVALFMRTLLEDKPEKPEIFAAKFFTRPDVKAIVLRVNSPGGSALASEIIWREVNLAKQKKKVVVSMGDYAASGGYYIACQADTIVAPPATVTGSIGVIGLRLNISKLLNKFFYSLIIRLFNFNKYKHIDSFIIFGI